MVYTVGYRLASSFGFAFNVYDDGARRVARVLLEKTFAPRPHGADEHGGGDHDRGKLLFASFAPWG